MREEATCLVCGASGGPPISPILSGRYRVFQCGSCTLRFVHPLPGPAELAQYYSDYTVTNEFEGDDKLVGDHGPIVAWLLDAIGSKPRLSLDFGFGRGDFLRAWIASEMMMDGVEFSMREVNALARKPGCEALRLVKFPEDGWQRLEGRLYDLVTMFQVIEHLPDPVGQLREIAEHQPPGAYLYIECPNDSGLFYTVKRLARLAIDRGNTFGSLDPPQHLCGFNTTSLEAAVRAAGYEPRRTGTYGLGGTLHQPESRTWYLPLREALTRRHLNPIYTAGKSAVAALEPFLARHGNGAGLYCLAQKAA